ncbi:MAG TPA: orotidine-5'-phosphate decarboxylase [Planctomycetaceae bacterium]
MPAMSHYASRLHDAVRKKGTAALIGLDPRLDLLPPSLVEKARSLETNETFAACRAYAEFCCRLIDVVAPLVPAVKPQAAFFEHYGPPGFAALGQVVAYARKAGLIVILDAKRGDIGSTAEAYAAGLLGGSDPEHPWQADALTVSPYLGADTLDPFVKRATAVGGGIYVLVRTSNPGAGTFQDVAENGRKVFQIVAGTVERLAEQTADRDGYGCVGAVVGATYPDELKALRAAMPHAPLLVPGYGSQGGTAADVAAVFDANGLGAVINSSRAINFAYRDKPYADEFGPERWEDAAEAATRKMIADLAAVRSE